MARKRATPVSPPGRSRRTATATTTPTRTGAVLRTDTRARFTLYNLLGQERDYYRVDRVDLERPADPVAEQSVAHSIIVIDRSGSMSPWIEELKETLIKLLTLEEYRNFNLLVTLLSYSSQGDLQVHFQRAPISDIMKRESRQIQEIRKIRATMLTCMSQALELATSLVRPDELTAITLHSDGYANDPSANAESRTIDGLLTRWQDAPVFVNTIAYSAYSDFRLLSKIANGASGSCLRAGNLREVFDALSDTTRLLGGKLTPPIEEPLSPEYDYQVFVSHSAGKVNGAAGPLHIRGLKPEDDAAVYKYRKISRDEYDRLKGLPVAQTSEAVLAFARAHLAEGNLNTAKYALASTFDRTLFERHARALTNGEVAAWAQDLDLLLFQPGLIAEHEVGDEVPVNRTIPLLSLVQILADHRDGFRLDLDHLRQHYQRRGLRRLQGTRDESGRLVEPWLRSDLVDRDRHVAVQSFDVNRNTATLNLLIARKVQLVPTAGGEPIRQVAGVALDELATFNNYTLVGDGELNVPALQLRISDRGLFDRLRNEGVLEVNGQPAETHDPEADYLIRLDRLPLVPPFQGTVQLDGVFDQLAELKVLSSVCAAHLKEASDQFTPEQVEELKRHYLSKSLYLSFPTTTEYTDLQQALTEGTVDTRTSYKIDLGSRSILNAGKLHSANKCLERLYEVTTAAGARLDKPKFEDCLDGCTYKHKTLSAHQAHAGGRIHAPPVRRLPRRGGERFSGVGAAPRRRRGPGPHRRGAGRGQQPERAAFVQALTSAGRALDREAERLFNEKVSPLVFYVGSTGTLPDEIAARAHTAEEITTRYPDLAPSKDEQEGLFFEVGEAILTVYAKTEYFSRDRATTAQGSLVAGQNA